MFLYRNTFLINTEKWESEDKFIKNNFELFKERYNNRILNFKNYINEALINNNMIIFIFNTNVTPITLCDIIKNKYPNLKFKIICNQLDKETSETINNFENDVCNYDIINEKCYDKNYIDSNIIMDGWNSLDKLELTLL